MPVNDNLGARMKENYESVTAYKLTKRTPVVIRLRWQSLPHFYQRLRSPIRRCFITVYERNNQISLRKYAGRSSRLYTI